MTSCEFRVASCPSSDRNPRHRHVCADINQTGERCGSCAATEWVILFGGVLPVMVCCAGCGAGFNLTERLRVATVHHKRRGGART